MGCGGSKFDSQAEPAPARIRPLLRRRFEEMRRRRNAAALKNSHIDLSKKELLKDGVSECDTISSPPRDTDGKSISSSQEDSLKVAPVLESDDKTISKDGEHDQKVLREASMLRSVKVAPAPEPEKLTKEKSIKWSSNSKDEDKEGMEALQTAAIFAAVKAIKTSSVHVREERREVTEEDEDEIGRLSSITCDSLCPGSPSFRVYFIESLANIKDDDELLSNADKEEDSDKKSVGEDCSETTESRNSIVDSETKTKKKAKRASRLRKVIPMGRTGAVKNLLNVKSCYNPACGGHDNARLLANKADA